MTLESSAGGGVLHINITFIRTDQAFNVFFLPDTSDTRSTGVSCRNEMHGMFSLGADDNAAPRSNTSSYSFQLIAEFIH